MTEPLFELAGVSHGFPGGVPALDNINTSISSEGCLAMMGCNGAGKSTLLHILAGLVLPVSGQAMWHGQTISPQVLNKDKSLRSDFRRRVGIVFQDPDSQWLCDTVLDEVMYGPLQIWPKQEATDRASSVIQIMGIEHLATQPPYVLSGGEKRRVALASVIAMDPDTLLLDEPTSNLDAATIDFLITLLQEFKARPGKTVIMATHDLPLVEELADRCLVLTPCHKVARTGSLEEIMGDRELLRQMNLVRRRDSGAAITRDMTQS